jgi:transcriptional regulator with XRE-family HTH domain
MSGDLADTGPGPQDPVDRSTDSRPHAELAELAAIARISSSQSLSRIPDGVAPGARDFAETLRVLFGALDMSLSRLAALLHSDPGTVSRYLSGKRIPPPDFIDGLCKAVYDVRGSLITVRVQDYVHEQFLVALREHNPARYEVQRLTDLLEVAALERQQHRLTVTALQEAIASRNDKIYALDLETRQLRSGWASAEGLLEEERRWRERLQETINSLYLEVTYLKDQLVSAQQRAVEAEGRCLELEIRLDAAGAFLQGEDQNVAEPLQLALGSDLVKYPSPPGWSRYSDITPDWFRAYVGMEEAASSIRSYEAQFIPGLLQTERYAAAVISLGDYSAEEAEQLVALRKERQHRFRDGKLKLWIILDEAVLRRPVAGIAVQIEQLRYLKEACASPSLTLQIVPYGAGGHVVPTGFSILRFTERDFPDVVYLENLTSALYLDQKIDLDRYMLATERLAIVAYEPQETQRILDEIVRQLAASGDE